MGTTGGNSGTVKTPQRDDKKLLAALKKKKHWKENSGSASEMPPHERQTGECVMLETV